MKNLKSNLVILKLFLTALGLKGLFKWVLVVIGIFVILTQFYNVPIDSIVYIFSEFANIQFYDYSDMTAEEIEILLDQIWEKTKDRDTTCEKIEEDPQNKQDSINNPIKPDKGHYNRFFLIFSIVVVTTTIVFLFV